ncbi:hypothetical protein BXZ70DRAFT_315700 [Cristinia sonorae]|uniref:DUF4470 domain-containing protein n=1 Tax=Cristinia sonorae TaxID=1940300 RepID=A0A8K0UMJ0_9AGAR|nr:hypothetical protein BXZ70DRAFT_315700 [Cristinia sonorae]
MRFYFPHSKQTCQEQHWSSHKRDCKDSLLSPTWMPMWAAQDRKASFIRKHAGMDKLDDLARERVKYGQMRRGIWSNTPAIDVLNLEKNEGTTTNRNLNLAFISPTSLADLIYTINRIPATYSGDLTILLDHNDSLSLTRNTLMLLVLGRTPDTLKAAEIVLHLWYSAFVQASHAAALMAVVLPLVEELKKPAGEVKIGERSTLQFGEQGPRKEGHSVFLATMIQHLLSKYDFEKTQAEYQRVFLAPAREDFLHRKYVDIEPSHRLAYDQFRRFGVLLPFGAPSAHFNQPNQFLFSPECEWYQDDGVDPFKSWDIKEVLDAGQARGVHRADIFGSLYFYVLSQLQSFAHRIQTSSSRIAFHCRLAPDTRNNNLTYTGLPRTTRFDRISVSNLIDHNYAGLEAVLKTWGLLLNTKGNTHATLVGYFKNWVAEEPRASHQSMSPEELAMLVKRKTVTAEISLATVLTKADHKDTIFQAIYDNSAPFVRYLNELNAARLASAAGLKLKQRHTIVPHRLDGRFGDPPNAVPFLPDQETWYLKVFLGNSSFLGRTVEFGPA